MKKILHKLRARVAVAGSSLVPVKESPDELLGQLFQDVQLKRVYPDGITFVDLVPEARLKKILKLYQQERQDPHFDLHVFVKHYFKDYLEAPAVYTTNPDHSLEQHVSHLWDVLTREAYKNKGSLLALPHPYIVPGGRFSSQFYWDSYFTMLGLVADERWDLAEGMVKNLEYMLLKFGMIPTGNRTYFLSRSHPPFFAPMVRLLAEKQGRATLIRYLPAMLAEYKFWMTGRKKLSPQKLAFARVVRMPDGAVLNRYFDNKSTPRPESYKEDVDTALSAPDRTPSKVYLDLRAGAESGWDYSSRWFKNENSIATIHTTDLIPVDLNCLLAILEQTIADAYDLLKQKPLAKRFHNRAEERIAAINAYCWDAKQGFYFDYDFVADERTSSLTLAGIFPLFAGIAREDQAAACANVLKEKFLKPGGLVTTLATTGQQWDAPNGWGPLQWVAIQGLRRYSHHDLANVIKQRWISSIEDVFKKQAKLVEKYNVVDPSMTAGGGEYVLQDGFGWTNGVLLALLREQKHDT